MNQKIKRVFSAILAATLCLGMVACGKDTEGPKKDNNNTSTITSVEDKVEKPSEDVLAYVPTFKDLSIAEDKNGYIMPMRVVEDKILYILNSFDEDGEFMGRELHEYDINSSEDKVIPFDFSMLNENSYVQDMELDNNGNVWLLYGINEDYNQMTEWVVTKLAKDYSVETFFSLGDFFAGMDYAYISDWVFDKGNNMVILANDTIFDIAEDGRELCRIPVSDMYVNSLFESNGEIYVNGFSRTNVSSGFCKVDFGSKSLGKMVSVGDSLSNGDVYPIRNNNLLVSSGSNVSKLNLETGEQTPLWNWFEVNATGLYFEDVSEKEDGSFSFIYSEWDEVSESSKYYMLNIKQQLVKAEDRKIDIYYACMSLDSDISDKITKYNRESTKYRVIPIEYFELYSWEEASDRLMMDIASGKDMDIIDIQSLDASTLNSNALLDIYPLLTNDPDINLDDFYTNVFDAFKTKDGKLNYLCTSAAVVCMITRPEYLGDKGYVSIEDILELRKNNPNKSIMEYGFKEGVLATLLQYGLDRFVDTENATCDFNSDAFTSLLELANSYPKDINWEEYDDWAMIQRGDILFSTLYLYDVDTFKIYSALLGDDIAITGFPNNKKTGGVIMSNSALGICATSTKQGGAWDFIKSMLSEKIQDSFAYSSGFPVRKSSFDKLLNAAMEGKNTSAFVGNGSLELELSPLTSKEADAIRKAYSEASKTLTIDEQLYTMILEEVDPFFEGQKSAKDVAAIIQSRVSIYLAENN